MTPAIIISPYASPDPAARRLNVRRAIAMGAWASAHGYCPIGHYVDVDPNFPPSDTDDPDGRAAALERSAMRARMVGAAGGVAIAAGWCDFTNGMRADYQAWYESSMHVGFIGLTLADIEPYLPRDLVGGMQKEAPDA